MKKRISFTLLFSLLLLAGKAQVHHKIVFDLTSKDTANQSRLLRQFNNVLKEAPDAELEVVCHGYAVNMVVKSQTVFEEQMKELAKKGKVSFKVCANSMKRLGVDKSQLIPLAEVVPMAILELSAKQQQGWSYIWSGE